MENFLNRYRSITVLLLVIFAQLVLLAVQMKSDQDVRFIRLWTVTAVTPVARILETVRGGSIGLVRNYILLHDANQDNRRLQAELDRLKVENIFLKNEVSLADRAKALQLFQVHTPSKSLAASVIGTGAGSGSKVFFVDRGSSSGVERGMPVVTPDGIVGKVTASYPTASEVLLITDPEFAAGVVSQKHQTYGTLKGQGTPTCKLDYVPPEDKVEPGEWLYTSGDDRVFPRGFPVGTVKAVRPGQPFQEIDVEPSGLQRGVEDVLILIEGVHQGIPEAPPANQPVYIAAPPPASAAESALPATPPGGNGTDADKLRVQYKAVGDAQGHKFGEGAPGSKPPDFNLKLPGVIGPAGTAPATQPAPAGQAPAPASAPPARTTPPVQTPAGQSRPVPPVPASAPGQAPPTRTMPAGQTPAGSPRQAPAPAPAPGSGPAPATRPASPAQTPAPGQAPATRTAPSGQTPAGTPRQAPSTSVPGSGPAPAKRATPPSQTPAPAGQSPTADPPPAPERGAAAQPAVPGR